MTEQPKELERVVLRNRVYRLFNCEGDYQIVMGLRADKVMILDDPKEYRDNTRIEQAFERIKKSKNPVTQFNKEKKDLALEILEITDTSEDLEGLVDFDTSESPFAEEKSFDIDSLPDIDDSGESREPDYWKLY